LAGTSEHIIKIQATSDSKGTGSESNTFDINGISTAIESSLNRSMKSMEVTISNAIVKALSNSLPDSSSNEAFSKQLARDVKGAIVEVVNKAASSDTSSSARDLQKEITTTVKSVLTESLQSLFKANKVSNERTATTSAVKSISSSIPTQGTNDIAKVAQELSIIAKALTAIPNLSKEFAAERGKASPDNSKMVDLLEAILSTATSAKESYKSVRAPISRIDSDQSIGAVSVLSAANKQFTTTINKISQLVADGVVVKVTADTAQASKDIEELAKNNTTTITVEADTAKAKDKLDKLIDQDVMSLSIDLEKDAIPAIYDRLKQLQNKINDINNSGIALDIDTKAVQDLQDKLTKLVRGFDYVKGSLGREQYNKTKELQNLPDRNASSKLPERSRVGVEARRDKLEKVVAELESTRVAMNAILDRKESSFITNDRTKKSDVLTIEHDFAKLGKVQDLKISLSNEDISKFVKSDRRTTTLQDSSGIEDLVKEVNTLISHLGKVSAGQDNTKLIQAIDKNTASLDKGKLADAIDKFKKEASTNKYSISNAEKAVSVKYSEKFIKPNVAYAAPEKVKNEYELKVYENMSKLSMSLDKLQQTIYNQVSEGLKPTPGKKQYTDWKVVENEGSGSTHNRAFNLRGREWAMDVVDMKKLRSLTGKQDGSPKELLKTYSDKLATSLLREKGHKPSSLKLEIADWLKSNVKSGGVQGLNPEVRTAIGKDVLDQLSIPNIGSTPVEDIAAAFSKASNSDLKDIFAKTVGFSDIQKSLADVKRTIAIPAAKLTNTGSTVLETQHGSQRSTLQLAEYKSGHERAFEGYIKNATALLQKVPQDKQESFKEGITPEILQLARAARSANMNTDPRDIVPDTTSTYEEASRLLLKGVASKGGVPANKEDAASFYKKAIVPISIERQRITRGTSGELKAKDELVTLSKQVDTALKSSNSVDEFMANMDAMGLSATRVIKSLDSLNFSNVYDAIERATGPKLEKIVGNIATSTGAIGDFEKTISSLEGMMPIVEKNAPRRGMHQGDTVSAMFNYSKAHSMDSGAASKLLTPEGKYGLSESVDIEERGFKSNNEAKKAFITNFNRRANELFYEASSLPSLQGVTPEVAHRQALLNVGTNKQLTSLGLPESPASNLETTPDAMNRPGRTVPMYTGNLREIAPFSLEYQQTGRNISGISSAKGFDTGLFGKEQGISSEFPKLRSESEDKVIQAGRFGKSGIGYNVLAELRHTAGTFEDQILVSGKLADAATTAVRKLVRPKASAGKASTINEGPIKDSDIEEVTGNIMSVMGIDEKYKRRPDKAFISNVKNEVTTNRGASVEVQSAKLAELFLNHFGRKLTTRYGSKGVSVTPTSPSTLGDIISAHKDSNVKVLAGDEQKKAGLGVAFMPKSMGELSSDILGQQDTKTKEKISAGIGMDVDVLAQELKDSGNKFILDIFTDVNKGLVTENEAIKNLSTFDKAKKAFAELDINLAQNIEGINQIKGMHVGEKTTAKAIDVRISSYGAAKRGLQTEPLEMVANNLASSKGNTVIKNTIDDQKNSLISGKSGGSFSKYSKALGFSGSGKTDEELQSKITSMFSKEKLQDKSTQDAIKAMIELEKKSSYYVEVVDELNNRRKSLVGEKFLSIVEEPTQTEEWSKGAIESLSKGIKLNIPAYAAYTSTFGEDSAFMKSLNENFTDKQAEHYDNILTYLVNTNEEYKNKVLGAVKSIDIKDLKSVNKDATKTFNEGDPGSLLGTIFDTDKLPGAYKTTIPSTTSKDAPGEDLYIPRSISRTSYADPMQAGAYGIKKTGSKLQDVIDKSRSLQAFYNKDTSMLLDTDVTGMSGAFGSTAANAMSSLFAKDDRGRSTGLEQSNTEEAVAKVNKVKQELMQLLVKLDDQGKLSKEEGSLSTGVQNFYNSKHNLSGKFDNQKGSESDFVKHLGTKEGFNSPTALAAMKNMLIGTGNPNVADTSVLAKATDTSTRLDVMTGVSNALGNKDSIFSYGRGANSEEKYNNQVTKRQEDLDRSKQSYQDTLRKNLVGKKGSVARTFFTRNIPSVLAKATNATVDKTEELTAFSQTLKGIEGLDLGQEISTIEKLTEEHAQNVSKYKDIGMPVLKQHELGVSSKLAEKLKVNFTKRYDKDKGTVLNKDEDKNFQGTLKDLLEYSSALEKTASKIQPKERADDIKKYIDTELSPFVESVRFPFTGTSSLKPYKAKLVQTAGGIGDDALMVPGTPEMDMGAFEDVYNSIKDKVKSLSKEREAARTVGDDTQANALTGTIDKLNSAISAVLPKYVAHAQKLDYDGDQIELHTAKTSEARNDIYKHFQMLTKDIDSTAGKFGDYYSYDAKQPSQGDLPLSYMSQAFSKKFDSSKGYSFLDKPFTTEDLSYLSPKEKVGILASKEQDLNMTSGGESVSRVMRAIYEKVGAKFDDKSIKGIDDLGEASEAAVAELNKIKDIKIKSFIEGYLKEELSNMKLDTAVNAQLFKINTGTDTESMTRLMRAYESKRGFGDGTGEIGLSSKTKSGKIDSNFVNRERNTQLNEFFRFAIQKGMDVKHAGERPIAGELVKGVTTGKAGLEGLLGKLEKNKSYDDLKKFKSINEDSLRNTFGKFSTQELKDQAASTGIPLGDTTNMSRSDLTDALVNKLGFEGFLRDLQGTIEQLAVKGIQANSEKPISAEVAFKILSKRYESKDGAPPRGIDVSRMVTDVNDPMYKFRTGGYSVDDKFDVDFKTGMDSVAKTFRSSGAYAELVKTFESLGKEGVNQADYIQAKQLIGGNREDFTSGKVSMGPIKELISSMENTLGLAPMSDRKQASILTSPEYVAKLADIPDDAKEKDINKISKANARLGDLEILIARLDRISEVSGTRKDILPEAGRNISLSLNEDKEEVKRASMGAPKSAESTTSIITTIPPQYETSSYAGSRGEEPPHPGFSGGDVPPNIPSSGGPGTGGPTLPATGGGAIPVFIAGLNDSLVFSVKLLGQLVSSSNINSSASGISGGVFKDEDSGIGGINQKIDKFKTTEEQRKSAAGRAQSMQPYEGNGPVAELANLRLLRDASKSLYKARGMDFDNEANKLTKEAQDYINNAKKQGGIHTSDFLDLTKNAGILNRQDPNQGMSGEEIATAWRLYKDAEIEYLLKKADDAENMYTSVMGMGGNEEGKAYNNFESAVNAVQQKIIADTGKRSDIYTANKVWAFPDIAKAAGVYQSPVDIQRKSNRDLGDTTDPDSELLKKVFDDITGDLSGKNRGNITAPTDKARNAIKDLTEMNDETLALMANGKLLERLGPEIAEAWNFEAASERITRLRSALELFKQFNVSDSPLSVESKNLENTIKLLKDAENKLSKVSMDRATQSGGPGVWGETGVVQVPKWADPEMQQNLHKRNISKLREYYGKGSAEGGAKIGERYSYDAKVFDDSGKPIENQRVLFHKLNESVDSAGKTVGIFTAKQEDMAASLAGANRGFLGAIERAIKWGAASSLIYGGVDKLKEAVETVAEVEVGMAKLKMVMPSKGTDFEGLQSSAVGMAKQYGTPTTGVLDAMVVYAQQGLSQAEVIDRTQTSMLASNVTTLKAKDATEALTAAMKIFRTEGDRSMRFLDSWSEVESKHAITAGDMAEAIKKSAAAASTAGITFDQLNGIVASIGSVTRQSGKEVGTSLRFIMRRLSSEKGPNELAKLNVATVTGEGELRGGFEILGDLAEKWKELNSAQKLTVAQAIGGTRQYNSLLVLMENWQEALDGVQHSMNSQGSASRRNAELMQTYSKQVEQTKAAFLELQLAFGKIAFPAAKFGLQSMKAMAETVSAIPKSFKIAGVAALGLFTYLSKGAKILDTISNFFSGGTPIVGNLIGSIKDELKTASFEVIGAGSTDTSSRGLKTLIGGQPGREQGRSIRDFESAIGKAAYLLVSAGKSFNDTVGGGLQGTGRAGQGVGQSMVRGGSWLSAVVSSLGGGKYGKGEDVTYKDLAGGTAAKFAKSEGVKGAFAAGGLKGVGKVASSFLGVATEVAGLGAAAGGIFIDEFSKKLGAGGDVFKEWAKDNAGVVKAIAPMLLTLGLLTPAIKALGTEFMNTTRSSQDFADSMFGAISKDETDLISIRDTQKSAGDLQKKLKDVSRSQNPEVADKQKYLGTYVNPLNALSSIQSDALKLSDKIARENYNMIAGYDKLGNVILRTADNYQTLIGTFERSKIRDLAAKDSSVAAKHIEALTKTDGSEKWKSELKDLTKEIPVIGDLISNQISIAPAKSLEILTGKLNNLVSKKNAAPMSTVYDGDIKNLQDKLSKVKDSFNNTYSEFKRALSNIPTEGLGQDEIARIMGADELQAGYQLMIDVEPQFNVKGIKGNVTKEDVLGAEVMKRLFPNTNNLGATKALSVANTETAGLAKREGKLLSGDLVTFTNDAADRYNIAGQQAIVKLKETSDGIFEWVATYFNTKTLKVTERKFDSNMQDLVESILPTKAIEQDMSERIEALGTFVTGASAGLIGIAKKSFKTDFNLGERFFSDINTSTIIQGDKGFDPTKGFGESPFQKGWSDDFEKYYNKPLHEYKTSLEQLEKMHLDGLDAGSVEMSTGLYDSIRKLQDILKNNQIVLQYRAVFADLTKTMEANTRAVKENIAVEKTRTGLAVETSGLLKGKDASLANIDLGKYNKADLSSQERLLIKSPEFAKSASRIKELDIKKSGTAEQLYSVERSKVALESIKNLSSGFGSSIGAKDFSKYTEMVAKTGDLGLAELKIDTSNTAENTAMTVDKLDEILANLSDRPGSEAMQSSFMDALDFLPISPNLTKNERLNEALDRVASIRNDALSSGDTEKATKANIALDDLTKQLVDRMGIAGAANKADSGLFGSGAFKGEELIQRAFGGLDFKTLASEMKANMKDETSWFGLVSKKGTPTFDKTVSNVQGIQDENIAKSKESSIFNSKNIAGATAGFGIYQAFNSNFSNKKVEAYDKQIADLKKREDEVGFIDYAPQMASLTSSRDEEAKKARMYGTMRYAAGGASGGMMLARNMGMSEDNIKRLGAGGAALGVYGAAKMNQGMTGDDLPQMVKEFGKEVAIFAAAMKDDGIFSTLKKGAATSRFKDASEGFMKQFAEETLDLKVTPNKTSSDRDAKYSAASDSFTKTKDDVKFDAEWKAKEFKRKVENPNADLRSNTKDSVNQSAQDLKDKFADLKEYIKTSGQDAVRSATEKMARGEEVNLKEEMSKIYEGTKSKTGDVYGDIKEKTGSTVDTLSKTAEYASTKTLGAIDALVEALSKNTEAVNGNAEGNAHGGFIQKFATGGTVKQLTPGFGDKQPALLTAGEEVLTAKQGRKLKPILDALRSGTANFSNGITSAISGTTSKYSAKLASKIGLKKIPGVGTVAAAGFAAERAATGDYLGAGLEVASGLASNIPVVGTAASFMIDGALMGKDLLTTKAPTLDDIRDKKLALQDRFSKLSNSRYGTLAAGAAGILGAYSMFGGDDDAAYGMGGKVLEYGKPMLSGIADIPAELGRMVLGNKAGKAEASALGTVGLSALILEGQRRKNTEEGSYANGGFISTGVKGLLNLAGIGLGTGATATIAGVSGLAKLLKAKKLTKGAQGTSSFVKKAATDTSSAYNDFKTNSPGLYSALATATVGTAGGALLYANSEDEDNIYDKYDRTLSGHADGGFTMSDGSVDKIRRAQEFARANGPGFSFKNSPRDLVTTSPAGLPALTGKRGLSKWGKLGLLGAGLGLTSALFSGDDDERHAGGGFTTGLIKGAGTGTSDSIRMRNVPEGSFIIPSKYSQKAKEQLGFASGGSATSDIRVSNGEYFISAADAKSIGKDNLNKMQHGQKPSFANGGVVNSFASGGEVSGASTIAIDQDSINRFAQAAAAASAFTLTRYAAGKTEDKTRNTDLGNLADSENTAIYEAVLANSDAAQKVYDSIRTPGLDNASGDSVDTEEVSRIFDTTREYNKALDDTATIESTLIAEHNKYNKEIAKLKEEMRKADLAEKFIMQIESMNKAIADSNFADEFKRSLKLGTGAFEGFSGPRDLNIDTKGVSDLNSLELLQLVQKRKEDQRGIYGPTDWAADFKNFSLRLINSVNPEDTYNNKYRGQNVLKEYSKLEDQKLSLTSRMNAGLQNRSQATDESEFEKWDDFLKETAEELENVTAKQDGYAVAVKEAARKTDAAAKVISGFKDAMSTITSIRTDALYSMSNRGMGGRLRGATNDVSLIPNSVEDLNSTQYAHMQASAGMQNTMSQYKVNTTLYDSKLQKVKELEDSLGKLKLEQMQTSDRGIFFKDNQPQRIANDITAQTAELTRYKEELEKIGRGLESNSLKMSNFLAATDAAKQFETSINTVKASMFSASMGADALQSKLDNMYGGSGAFAPQFIDVNERQTALRSGGVSLENGKSNQFDRERANLMTTLRNSSGQQWLDARMQLSNLPEKEKEYKQHEQKLRESQMVRESLRPAQDSLSSMAQTRTKINTRIWDNAYSDMDAQGNSESKKSDIKAVEALDEGYKKLTDLANSILDRGTPVKEDDFKNMRDVMTGTTEKLGGASVQDLKDSKGTSSNPLVSAMEAQTKVLTDTLLTAPQLIDALKVLHVEKSPSTFEAIAKLFTPDDKKWTPGSEKHASGGTIGAMIRGAGTGTSDDISMSAPAGSYIIQSKYAQAAKNSLKSFASGGQVPINVSNGELMLTPEEVAKIGGTSVADALNSGNNEAVRASWSEQDYNNHGFANEKDYKQQTGGLGTPMIDPVDILTGFGAAGLAKNLIAKASSKSAAKGLSGYLKEAQGIMGTNLNVSKYTKELVSNKALLKEVMSKGQAVYGEGSSLAQIVTRSGPIGLKNMVDHIASQGFAYGGSVKEQEKLRKALLEKYSANAVVGLGKPAPINASIYQDASGVWQSGTNLSAQKGSSSAGITATGIPLDKVAENFSAILSTERTMVSNKATDGDSVEELLGKISSRASFRDSNAKNARSLSLHMQDAQLMHATTPEEIAGQQKVTEEISKLTEISRGNTAYYEESLKEPTTNLIARQFNATSMGARVNKPTNRWSDIKGLSVMNGTGKGANFVKDSLNKGPDALSQMQEKLDIVSVDSPERKAYLAKLSEKEQVNFMKGIEIAQRNVNTLVRSGGMKAVLTNQRANFMMTEAFQNLGASEGFYLQKSDADIAKFVDDKYGKGTFEKRKNRNTRGLESYNNQISGFTKRAGNDPDFYKKYIQSMSGTVPNAELIELIKRIMNQSKGESIKRNGETSNNLNAGGAVNNLSRQVRHNGGVAHKSGSYFLEGGEVILDKNFFGGDKSNQNNASSINSQPAAKQKVEIEGLDTFEKIVNTLEKSLSKLTNIKIEGIDKLTDIKIEGLSDLRDIKIEGLSELKNIKIEGLSELKNIQIEGISDLRDIKIEGLDNIRDIKVEGLEKLTNIKIDNIDQLKDISIAGLENLRDIKIVGLDELKDINVKSSSVGADMGDMFASTLKDFDSRVGNLEKSSADQISLIKTTVQDIVAELPILDINQKSEIAGLKQNLMATTSEVSNLTSSMKRFSQEVSVTLRDLNDRQNTAMTHIYSIKRN